MQELYRHFLRQEFPVPQPECQQVLPPLPEQVPAVLQAAPGEALPVVRQGAQRVLPVELQVRRAFPAAVFRERGQDRETREAIAANFSANLLGLGNAATPLGLKAIAGMHRTGEDSAGDDMCTLVVCNAASLQLIPTTVAAVRAAEGCASPFDILPAVWISSAAALCVGLGMCRLLRRFWKR